LRKKKNFFGFLANIELQNFFFKSRIKEKHIAVWMIGGGDDTGNQLLRELDKKAGRSHNGSSYRWAVAATDDGDVQLQLQVILLPVSAIASKPQLAEDNAAVCVANHADSFQRRTGAAGTSADTFRRAAGGTAVKAEPESGCVLAAPEQGHEKVKIKSSEREKILEA
jgi:hypothetical protein